MSILLLKLLHLLFVISWMAGVFYLPRLLVHYKLAIAKQESTIRLQKMAQKLYRFSLFTGSLALASGLWLGWSTYQLKSLWLWLKIATTVGLAAHFLYCGYVTSLMSTQKVPHSALFWRVYNEIAVLLLIVILFLVVYKPG